MFDDTLKGEFIDLMRWKMSIGDDLINFTNHLDSFHSHCSSNKLLWR